MARIVLIDDDISLLDLLAMAFEDAGHTVEVAATGPEGLARVRGGAPDAVVCDVNLPGLDGFSICRRLRAEGNVVPLVLLTSRDNEVDEALGLEFGADDYVAKPFSTRVLLARVAALLRRDALRAGAGSSPPALTRGRLELSPERLEVRLGGCAVNLTVTEFRLLEALVRRAGNVLSREQLLRAVRDDDSVVVERIIDTYVRRLRRKFEIVDPSFDEIVTVVGAGYRWKTR